MLVAEATLAEELGVLLVAEALGQACQRRVGDIVFQGVGHGVVARLVLGEPPQRYVPAAGVRVYVAAHEVVLARRGGRLAEGLISRVDVEAAQALEPRVSDDGYGRVALHGPRLAAEQLPARHPAPLAIHVYHRAHHVNLAVGVEQGLELVQVAVSVPKRVDGVARAIGVANAVALHRGILAVHVLQDARLELGVVERGVEHALLRLGAALDGNLAQGLLPFLVGQARHVVERLAALLHVEVLPRVLD